MLAQDMKQVVSLCEGKVSKETLDALKNLVEGKDDGIELNLLDLNDCFASILWSENDIANALENEGIDPTEENIATVLGIIQSKYLGGLQDCSDGWEQSIVPAVREAFPNA